MASLENTKLTESTPESLYSYSICGLQNRKTRLENTISSNNMDIETLSTRINWSLNEKKDNKTVDTLKKQISEQLNIDSGSVMKVLYGGIELEKDTDELSQYVLEMQSGTLFEPYIVVAIKEGKCIKNEEKIVIVSEPKVEETKENSVAKTETETETESRTKATRTVEERLAMYNSFEIKQKKAKDPVLLEECEDCYVLPQCGHGFCGDSLLDYAWNCVCNKKVSILTCPYVIEDTNSNNSNNTNNSNNNSTTSTSPTICGTPIPFVIVKRILSHYFAKQDQNKFKDIQQRMASLQIMLCENFLHEHYDVQKCGKCNSILYRDLKEDRTATVQFKSCCPICSSDKKWQKEKEKENEKEEIKQCVSVKKEEEHNNKDEIINENIKGAIKKKSEEEEKEEVKTTMEKEKNELDHIFCWSCQNEWKDINSEFCGNEQCQTLTRAQVISFLSSCSTKTIGQVADVPEIRGCPTCGQMVNHTEACKHMACRCTAAFCFVCMKPKLKNGNWQCGGSSDVCPVYKRQTNEDLPAGNRSVVKLFSLIDKK